MAMRYCSSDDIELIVPCKPEYVRTVRAIIEDLADSVPLSREAIEEVKVAASEAVANIVRHAYDASTEPEPVVVKCSVASGKLIVEIIDRGVGFKVPADGPAPKPDISKEGGMGILLIRNLMDKVDYWSQPNLGTRIKMTKLGWTNKAGRNGKKSAQQLIFS